MRKVWLVGCGVTLLVGWWIQSASASDPGDDTPPKSTGGSWGYGHLFFKGTNAKAADSPPPANGSPDAQPAAATDQAPDSPPKAPKPEGGSWGSGHLFFKRGEAKPADPPKPTDKLTPAKDPEKDRSGEFPSWGKVNPNSRTNPQAKDLAEAQKHKQEVGANVSARSRAQDALLRRLAVCDQIRLAASETGDEDLMRRADELDEQARQVYAKRIARLPASQARPGADKVAPKRTNRTSSAKSRTGKDGEAGAEGLP